MLKAGRSRLGHRTQSCQWGLLVARSLRPLRAPSPATVASWAEIWVLVARRRVRWGTFAQQLGFLAAAFAMENVSALLSADVQGYRRRLVRRYRAPQRLLVLGGRSADAGGYIKIVPTAPANVGPRKLVR